jgi:hypothetical protein
MLTEDYLIRQINIFLAALARIIGFRTAYMYTQARIAIDEALEELFGIRANLLHQLDDQKLHASLTNLEILDTDRLQLAADLFKEDGELRAATGDEGGARASWQRALNFYIDVVMHGGGKHLPLPDEQIEALYQQLKNQALDPDTWFGLYIYWEERRQYGRAAAALEALLTYEDTHDQISAEARAFYGRLEGLSDQELLAGGLDRSHVQAQLQRLTGREP